MLVDVELRTVRHAHFLPDLGHPPLAFPTVGSLSGSSSFQLSLAASLPDFLFIVTHKYSSTSDLTRYKSPRKIHYVALHPHEILYQFACFSRSLRPPPTVIRSLLLAALPERSKNTYQVHVNDLS